MLKIIVICALLHQTICSNDPGSKTLKLVQVVYRHGDRSPMQSFPKDKYNESTWQKFGAIGYEQLTWLGMKQQYELGQFFKKRYIDNQDLHMLGPKYDPREIYIRSTDIDRTLMSAYSNLAGMFPPIGNMSPWDVNKTLNWQPIPVHTEPISMDSVLSQDAICPKADQLYSQEQQTEGFKNKSAKYKDLLQKISKWTGVPHESLEGLWKVTDTLTCENAHSLVLPNWTQELWPANNKHNKTVYDVMLELRAYEMGIKYGEPREKARLRGGPLIQQLVANINKTLNNSDTMTKFYMYSSHDNTLTALMKALQVYNDILPPFASAILVELYQDNVAKNYSITLLFKNETDNFQHLVLPGCDKICPYKKFVSLTLDMVPTDWTAECDIPGTEKTNEALIIGLGVGAGILLILILIAIVYVIRKKRGDTVFGDYYNVDTQE